MTNNSIVEVIKEGEIIRMPESQAIEEDLFVLRKVIEPETEIIVENPIIRNPLQREPSETRDYSRLERWRSGGSSIKSNKVIESLVTNFHWEIVRQRRKKGLSRKDLAKAIEVTEENMKVIEFGELPSDDFILISKIENHLGITLRKENKPESPNLHDLQRAREDKIREEVKKEEEKELGEIKGEEIELIEDGHKS